MELSGLKIKKNQVGTFRAQKIKTTHVERIFYFVLGNKLFSLKLNLQSLKNKNILYFAKKSSPHISG